MGKVQINYQITLKPLTLVFARISQYPFKGNTGQILGGTYLPLRTHPVQYLYKYNLPFVFSQYSEVSSDNKDTESCNP